MVVDEEKRRGRAKLTTKWRPPAAGAPDPIRSPQSLPPHQLPSHLSVWIDGSQPLSSPHRTAFYTSIHPLLQPSNTPSSSHHSIPPSTASTFHPAIPSPSLLPCFRLREMQMHGLSISPHPLDRISPDETSCRQPKTKAATT